MRCTTSSSVPGRRPGGGQPELRHHGRRHDGKSILERAIDELIELLEGRLNVVLPAGNNYEARCHAVWTWPPPQPADPEMAGAARRFHAKLPGDLAAQGRRRRRHGEGERPAGRTSVLLASTTVSRLAAPDSAEVDFGSSFWTGLPTSSGTMILVALAATAQTAPGAPGRKPASGRSRLAIRARPKGHGSMPGSSAMTH